MCDQIDGHESDETTRAESHVEGSQDSGEAETPEYYPISRGLQDCEKQTLSCYGLCR